MAIVHPQINPVALDLGMIELHWYGLMYLFAFVVAYFLAWVRTKSRTDFTPEMVSDLVFWFSGCDFRWPYWLCTFIQFW